MSKYGGGRIDFLGDAIGYILIVYGVLIGAGLFALLIDWLL